MKQQFSYDNPGWQGTGIPNAYKLTRTALGQIISALLRHLNFKEAWHVFQGFFYDFYFFHINSKTIRVKCPCCGWEGPAFLSTANWRTATIHSRCPTCDSRSRHRGLTILFPKLLENIPGNKILYFAPEKILLDRVRRIPHLIVQTTDLNSVDVDYKGEDIQKLSFPSGQFSALVCNHVLEHVPDDQSAIAECARVLSPNGIALFTIPGDYPDEKTKTYTTPDGNGHYRHYGMDVLKKIEPFFEVQALDMHEMTNEEFKVRTHDYVFMCRRK